MEEERRMSHPRDPANEIIPRLWLGNAKASMDEAFLREKNIQVVVNCTKNYPFCPIVPTLYRVPVDDNLEEEEIRNMELWATEVCFRILSEYKKGRSILVHCAAGIQRSAAAVAFLLIAERGMTATEAMAYIKERRPIAFTPRANFGRAIESFGHRFRAEILPEIQRLSR